MPGIEKKVNYYSARVRDPEDFSSIVTPQWMTKRATQLAKQWLVNRSNPKGALEDLVNSLDLTGEVKVRHGILKYPSKGEGYWHIQSILIPISWNLREEDLPDLLCFLIQELDKQSENIYCKKT